ncbi:hypothetical protein FG91_03210 [Sphingopyxis sp. LC81]|uniref:hypothetical protein n=1 Tax=Sphingopyxis sp. LC81 TaxID=1502850 RepID=UPI00050DA01C|nr:hypothetical protein [Sphingopyxis sp. LC81]KGB52472.1 hypothetical protein FG91_03210 [Sphingopyxis sp. LC81]
MRDEDKPFICYRNGKWAIRIQPRNAAGWKAMALWLLALVPAVAMFATTMESKPSESTKMVALLLYVLFMILWAVAGLRWMLARSEIVDVEALMAIKRRQDAARRGRPPKEEG